jgi:acetyl-CoA carboxylase carboxyltransferase component/biotin carboxyl carrier protein
VPISTYHEPSGRGVRVESSVFAGATPSAEFDPLIAKLVVTTSGDGGSFMGVGGGGATPFTPFESLLRRTRRALGEFHIDGVATNLAALRDIIDAPELRDNTITTRWLEDMYDVRTTASCGSSDEDGSSKVGLASLLRKASGVEGSEEGSEEGSDGGSGNRTGTRIRTGAGATEAAGNDGGPPLAYLPGTSEAEKCALPSASGFMKVHAPFNGAIVSVSAQLGDVVAKGQPLVVVMAMKMETVVSAPCAGIVAGITSVGEGGMLQIGHALVAIRPTAGAAKVVEEAWGESSSSPSLLAERQELPSSSPWDKGVAEREKLAALAVTMGGDAALVKHRARGRIPIRERIAMILDSESFREVAPLAGGSKRDDETGELLSFTPANFLLGTGRIGGEKVVVGGEDFTIKGGSPNVAGLRKSIYTETLALKYKIPLVRLHEGGGGAVGGSDTPAAVFGDPRFRSVAECLATVPVVTAGLGVVAGLPASRLVAAHFNVCVRSGQVLVAGPKVVEMALGYETTKEELGGSQVHDLSGVVDNYVDTEADALIQVRRFLSYLPSNVWGLPPVRRYGGAGGGEGGGGASNDPPERREEELLHIIPENRRQTYDMRRLVELVVDREPKGLAAWGAGMGGGEGRGGGIGGSVGGKRNGGDDGQGGEAWESSFFEMGTTAFGKSIVTGLARVNGQPVGVFANDPSSFAGAMTWDASRKLERFINFCCTFHLPIINVMDEPGFMVGVDAERNGTIRFGTAAVLAAQTAVVPWCTIHVRKAYGVAAAAHFAPDCDVIAWPSAESGTLPVESGVAVMFGRQIAEAEDPEAVRKQLEAKFSRRLAPWPRAESFGVHDVIDPRDTRASLCEWVEMAQLRLPQLVGPTSFPYRC